MTKPNKRMKTKAILLCDVCEAPILHADDGFVLYGAIGAAEMHGDVLLGDAFPESGTVDVQTLSTSAFCRTCFAKKLGLRGSVSRPAVPVSRSVEGDGEPLMPSETQAYASGADNAEPDFEVVDPLHAKTAAPAQTTPKGGRVVNVGAVQQVAPGAHVFAGVGVLPKQADNLPVVAGPIGPGSVVRVNANHPNYKALRGRAAQVERFREQEKDYIVRFANGSPMLGRAHELDKIG